MLVYCGSQKAGAFVDLNQPREEAAALHPPQGAWLEVTSSCAAYCAYELPWRRANVCRWGLWGLVCVCVCVCVRVCVCVPLVTSSQAPCGGCKAAESSRGWFKSTKAPAFWEPQYTNT